MPKLGTKGSVFIAGLMGLFWLLVVCYVFIWLGVFPSNLANSYFAVGFAGFVVGALVQWGMRVTKLS